MSETKTKNLCTVPAADLTDSQYFIAEDGGELKRIPKAQVVLKKLENMLATDTENLAGGGEVTAQELLDALAEQVANKLLAKSQVVNNLLATVEGNPLDATQGKALKELIDTTNNNLSNANSQITQLYSDKGKAIYSSDLFGKYDSPTFVIWDSNTANSPYKVGLTQGQEGFAIVYGDKSGWHTTLAWQKGGLMSSSVGWIHFFNGGTKIGWSKYVTEDNLNARFMNMSDFTIEKIKSIYDANIPIVGYINYTSAIAPDGNTGFVLAAAHCAIFISLTGSIYGLTSGNNWEKKN